MSPWRARVPARILGWICCVLPSACAGGSLDLNPIYVGHTDGSEARSVSLGPLFDDRVAPGSDLEVESSVYVRTHVCVAFGDICEGCRHVDLGYLLGRPLDAGRVAGQRLAQLGEQARFQRGDAGLGVQQPKAILAAALGARMVPFAGFEMPVEYSGVRQEHINVRENVGLFDVSHMGEFLVQGAGAA